MSDFHPIFIFKTFTLSAYSNIRYELKSLSFKFSHFYSLGVLYFLKNTTRQFYAVKFFKVSQNINLSISAEVFIGAI